MRRYIQLTHRYLQRMSTIIGAVALGFAIIWAQSEHSAASDRHSHHHHYAQLTKAPYKLRAKKNPFAEDRDALLAGRKLFEQHCAECHGSTAEGGRRAPSLRAPEVQEATSGILFWILTNGVVRRGMPVWSKLPEAQRWQIVTYLKSLGPPAHVQEVNGEHPSTGHTDSSSQTKQR